MKTIRKPLAILLAVTMLLTMLSACGKSPAQSFFDLFEETNKVTDRAFDIDISLTIDGTKIKASLEGSSYESVKQAQLTGSFGASGVSFAIPEILVDDDTVYVNADELSQLLQLFVGVDLSDTVNASYIEIATEDGSPSDDAGKELEKLVADTFAKVKADILSRKDAVVKNSDGSFTLTLDGVALLDLAKIVIKDLSDNRTDYINALQKLSPDSETVDEDTLNELWDNLEDALDALDDDLSAEDTEELQKTTIQVTIGKNKDKSYSVNYVGDTDEFSIKLSGTITPVKDVETFKAPTDTVSIDELSALADGLSLYGSDDDDWDDWDDTDTGWSGLTDTASYLLDTKRVGNDEAGYIDVPSEFHAFQEEGGIDGAVESFQYSDTTGKTAFTVTAFDNTTPENVASLLHDNLENNGADGVTAAEVTIADYNAYQIYGYHPDDNTFLVIWVFEAPDHDDFVHYLAIEFDADQYADVWELSETFSFSDASTGLSSSDDFTWEEPEQGSADDLNVTQINDAISEITLKSYNGAEIKAPVFNSVDWDRSYISTDLTSVSVYDSDWTYDIEYGSDSADWVDLEDQVTRTAAIWQEDDDPATIYDAVQSADGKVTAQAFTVNYRNNKMLKLYIISDIGDATYVAETELAIYDIDSLSVQPILDYYSLPDPLSSPR